MRNLTLLAAVHAHTHAIGYKNELVFRIPEDMKNFKTVTLGHQVIVGRKTWESIPNGLPKRDVTVITRNKDSVKPAENVRVCTNLFEALKGLDDQRGIFVIGGSEIYEALLPHASHMLLTIIDRPIEDYDAIFPFFDLKEWTRQSASKLTDEGDVVVNWLTRNT